jgi:glyoxylase-like metal-dependent hydrolase (beta-lactamase superfamily II)
VQQATGAQVYASPIERPVVEGRMPIPRTPPEKRTGLARFVIMPETTMPGTLVDREVQDGEALPEVLGGLQVVATPGHAPGHLAFWHPALRIVFCGDTIFRLPNLRLPFSFFTVDMAENKRSIRRVAQLDAAIACFGHGKPLTQDTAQALRSFSQRVGAG